MGRRHVAAWPVALVGIYLIIAVGTLMIWQARGVYLLVGDEPHYLVIAKALIESLSLDQRSAYLSELANPVIFAQAMEPLDPTLSSPGTQTFINSAGMFSVHAPGLGLILAVPFGIAGVLGAKLALIAIGAAAVAVAWVAVGVFTTRFGIRFAITLATAIGCPLLYSAGQVYPDVPAGAIVLLGLTWLLTAGRDRARWQQAVVVLCLAFLPWLQLKFSAPALILVLALAWQWRRTHRGLAIASMLLLGLSIALLSAFNIYAYGSVTGAYVDGGLELSLDAVMVLIGLFLDQNQGLLFLNPMLWLGLAGLVGLLRTRRSFAVIWVLVVLSLVVPNAMHPNWYGGGSFMGRFALPASMAFIIPAAAALVAVQRRSRGAFWALIAIGIAIQVAYWGWYALISGIDPGYSSGMDLYNKPAGTWLENYAVFGFPIERYLPAWYDRQWAFEFVPNLVWVMIAAAIVGLAFVASRVRLKPVALSVTSTAIALVAAAGTFSLPGARTLLAQAAELPSQTGAILGTSRVAERGIDPPAFITVGPQVSMRQGPYEIRVRYRGSAPPDVAVGRVELADAARDVIIRSREINGTLDASADFVDIFAYRSLTPQVLEVRVAWYGVGSVQVDEVSARSAQGR